MISWPSRSVTARCGAPAALTRHGPCPTGSTSSSVGTASSISLTAFRSVITEHRSRLVPGCGKIAARRWHVRPPADLERRGASAFADGDAERPPDLRVVLAHAVREQALHLFGRGRLARPCLLGAQHLLADLEIARERKPGTRRRHLHGEVPALDVGLGTLVDETIDDGPQPFELHRPDVTPELLR